MQVPGTHLKGAQEPGLNLHGKPRLLDRAPSLLRLNSLQEPQGEGEAQDQSLVRPWRGPARRSWQQRTNQTHSTIQYEAALSF